MMLRQVAHDLETGFPNVEVEDPARRVRVGSPVRSRGWPGGPWPVASSALYGPWPVGPDGSR
jgi:hypothetical protein